MNEYFTKDGRLITIQNPTLENAAELIAYSKTVFSSTDQLLTIVEEYTITVEKEREWIKSLNDNPNALLLIATVNHTIVGFLFFIPNAKRKIAHTGEFGVNVHPDYRGIGIGRELVNRLLQWAKQNRQIEKVVLQVFATNEGAIGLYKKMGFVEEGRFKKAIKQPDGTYVDLLQMYFETN